MIEQNNSDKPQRPADVGSGAGLGDLESALCDINQAEGYPLLKKYEGAKLLLASGKQKLERYMESTKWPDETTGSKTLAEIRAKSPNVRS